MMMKKAIFFFLLVLRSFSVLSNGGPIEGSYVQQSGAIKLINNEKIRVLKEDLEVKILGDDCLVKVRYLFKNEGQKEKVEYGFPVDYLPPDGYYIPNLNYVSGFKYLFKDEKLKYRIVEEDSIESQVYRAYGNGKGIVSRKWFITTLDFEKEGTQELKVEYRIKTNYSNYPAGLNYFSFFSDRLFLYDIAPCGFWGDGVIDEFSFKLKVPDFLCVDNIELQGVDGVIYDENLIHVDCQNFNPKGRKLSVKYDISKHKRRLDTDNYLPNNIVTKVSVSSQLQGNYKKEYLLDRDKNTAWVEGVSGGGIDEWIEFEFKENVIITGVGVLNGYAKNKSTYENNGKLKSVNVFLNERHFYESDHDHSYIFPNSCYKVIDENSIYSDIDLIYTDYDPGLQYDNDELFEVAEHTRKVKIIIKDIYKGAKYDDTCISEVFFYGYHKESNQ
ncbi:discoidin domain-containing protein [Flammeovirga sp. OC4]|uniref:discoidin domain-containing protein n=1 Tax=Flammeovirga sp. OC4 TaxID=1382345 RepID=UPI0005C6DCF1|nr:discoidin domain-containing protein [Flammeovirga sp. OC4]